MVNGRRDAKPVVIGPALPRWRMTIWALFRARSPAVLLGAANYPGVRWSTGHGAGYGVGRRGNLARRALEWGLRLFPERQLLLRSQGRVSYVTLSRRLQVTMAVFGVIGFVLLGFAATAPFIATHGTAERSADNLHASAPDPSVQAQMEQLQQQLAAANAQLSQPTPHKISADETQVHVKALEEARDHAIAERQELQKQLGAAQEAATNKSSHLSQINKTLDANRGDLRQSDAQRLALQNRVHQLETELDSANARTGQYKANLESIERKLQQLAAEHDKTVAERDRLQARLSELQSRSFSSGANVPATSDAAAAPSPPAVPGRAVADRPPDQRSDNGINEIERVIASTGIDVEKLLGQLGSVPAGQGGPYVALDRAKRAAAPSAERSEELQKIIQMLPLAAPLSHYQIESGFGGRADPFHGRQAYHSGLDLSSPYRSPVYSTAPGTVVFTGAKDSYGKVVEIDHGHGIVTRYAHLHRIVVANGQKVPVHQQVGELGSTGRSTGPHLHYEVLVNGTAQDPEKFMQAGKNVVQTSGK